MGNCRSRPSVKEDAPRPRTQELDDRPKVPKRRLYEAVGPEGYDVVQELEGSGGTEYTKLLRNKRTKEVVACKFVGSSTREGVPRGIEREIVNHRGLIHPNIVRFYEVLIFEGSLGIVSEYPAGGVLSERIAEAGPVTEGQAKTLFRQLLSGMQYCHGKRIWHRDLRVQNMYLDESDGEPCLKISGFGYSKSAVYDSNPRTTALTAPLNTPPELIKSGGNQEAVYDGSKVDVWGAGIILYVMLTGQQPFEDPESPGVMNKVVTNKIVKCSFSFPAEIQLTRECKDFLGRIFVAKPMDRLSIADMMQMPWLSGVAAPSKVREVVESKQDETQIAELVERARKRKENRAANGMRNPRIDLNKNISGLAYHGRRTSPANINPREVDGIAEYRTAPVYSHSS